MSNKEPWDGPGPKPDASKLIEVRDVSQSRCDECGTIQYLHATNPAENLQAHLRTCSKSPEYRLKVKLALAQIASQHWLWLYQISETDSWRSADAARKAVDVAEQIWNEVERRQK